MRPTRLRSHQVGDETLCAIADLIKQLARDADIPGRPGQHLFVTTTAAHATLPSFVADANAYATDSAVQVPSAQPGFLNFVDNWAPDWRACVFGREVSLLRPFGTFKAVGIPRGDGVVRFRYSPWPFKPCLPYED